MQLSFWIFFKHHTTFSLSVLSVQGVIRHTKSSSADVSASGAHSPHGSKLFLTSTDPAGTLGLHISEKHHTKVASGQSCDSYIHTGITFNELYLLFNIFFQVTTWFIFYMDFGRIITQWHVLDCLLIANSIAELRTRGEAPSICFTHSTLVLFTGLQDGHTQSKQVQVQGSRLTPQSASWTRICIQDYLSACGMGIALLQTLCNISYCHTCIDTQHPGKSIFFLPDFIFAYLWHYHFSDLEINVNIGQREAEWTHNAKAYFFFKPFL